MKFRSLTIGIPKEIMLGERRVAAIPETVKKMTDEGAVVLVEAGAGAGAFFNDEQYVAAGATIVADVEELYQRSDVILKVKEPKFNEAKNKHEVEMMKPGQYLITFLHPASPANHEMVKKLAAQGVIALTLDGIPRISRAQSMDALTSMSTVAGYKGLLMAVDALPKFVCMMATAVGMIPPAKVLVVGTGVAGLQAVATAKRLGAVVNALDIRPDACEQAKSLGAKVIDFVVPPEIAIGEGGYAKKLPDEWLNKEREALRPYVADADIVILTALIPGKVAPILVTQEMVDQMRPGSVIVDIAIDQGGNCELTKAGEVINYRGITINGIQNIPGMVPTSSTDMFAKNIYNLVSYLVQDGVITLDRSDEIVAKSLVTIDGQIVHAGTLEALGLA
ncbi:MAG: NAD(P) transhydrogenase subunit alpha [Firmicutes bacterium]|nr:NAD(P) transhydrogenase subunit alpha [Bacillota bacterium]